MVSRNWYEVYVVNDKSDGWSPENEAIIYAALNACYSYAWLQAQGCRSYAVKCTDSEVNLLIQELGDSCYGYCCCSLLLSMNCSNSLSANCSKCCPIMLGQAAGA